MENKTRLDELRSEIDGIDRQLLTLFLRRMDLCGGVADYKKSVNKPVLDSARERQVLESKLNMLDDPSRADEVYEFFSAVMSISRSLQSRRLSGGKKIKIEDMLDIRPPKAEPRVVFYGASGSYSELAAKSFFGAETERFNRPTFEDVFEALKCGAADYAVLPIENSNTGTIVDVMDLLTKYKYYIVGEIDVPIRHCLMGIPGAELSDIKRVYSHAQGIIQSREFIKTLGDGVDCCEYFSTSQSAEKVASDGDKTQAAIAGIQSAELYGLEILAKDINNSDKNTTRFIIVSVNAEIDESSDKISAAFTVPHESGELHRVLACFARGNLNLLKLESRPLLNRNFEYMFFVDYTGNLLDQRVREVTNSVIDGTGEFQLLGNYKLK